MATFNKYHTFLKTQMNGGDDTTGSSTAGASRIVDFDSDTIKIMLVTASYTPSAAGHAVISSASSNEVSGTGYTAGGATLTSPSITLTGGEVFFKVNDVVWSENASGFSNARYGIMYKSTGTPGTSTLIAYIDFITDKGNTSSDLVLQFNAAGIVKWF